MAVTILTPTQRKLLSFLSKWPGFNNTFYLTGGTALAEFYLQHRLSEDLDFFTDKEVDSLALVSLVEKVKSYMEADKVDFQESFNRNLVFFTFGQEVLKTEFTSFPFTPIEQPQTKEGIKIDSLLDIAVNKFFTIYQNPAARHFIDLYLTVKDKKVDWDKLQNLARIKFDTHIDPLQLGSQLLTATEVSDLPRMIIDLPESEWRSFFVEKAKKLKKEIEK